ncbi:MAG: hypothetical protein EBV29_00730 [Gammaproteobacteria bacterium]|nr:hypothetical protein [Gammaproteobacteria bacterium]
MAILQPWHGPQAGFLWRGVPHGPPCWSCSSRLPGSRRCGHFFAAEIFALAMLYSFGAHGIMTLNDFKSVQGDRRMGVGSLPVRLGVAGAARVACAVMVLAQIAVISLLILWALPIHAGVVAILLVGQLVMMARLLQRPTELDVWYNALGVPLYVFGMMVSALAMRGLS